MIHNRLKFFLKFLLFVLVGWLLCQLFPASLGIVDVNASPMTTVPFSGTQYFYTSDTVVPGDVKQFTVNNMPSYTFYGLVTGQGTFNSWAIPFNVPKEGFYDISFLTYAKNVWSDNIMPNNMSIFDGGHSNQVCTSSMSAPYPSGSVLRTGSLLLNVKCDNVYLKQQMYFLVTNYTFPVQYQGALGHTAMTFVEKTQQQAIVDSINKQTEETKKTNETLKDSSIDENININEDDLTDESGIQDLLLMPLTLMNAVNNGFNSSCSTFSLGSLYGHNLELKCFTISDVIGSNLAGIIDVIISGIFIYLFSKHLRKVFDRTTNLENEEGDVI